MRSARGGDITIERRRRDTETVCDLGDADVGVGQHRFGSLDVVVGEFWRTTSGAASAPSGGKPRLGTLSDQATLEFRQCSEYVKNQPPLRGRRVEGFAERLSKPRPRVIGMAAGQA